MIKAFKEMGYIVGLNLMNPAGLGGFRLRCGEGCRHAKGRWSKGKGAPARLDGHECHTRLNQPPS